MSGKKTKFNKIENKFRCPICSDPVSVNHQNNMVCRQGHCFDISAKGYVNFIPNKGVLKEYTRDFFEKRRDFMAQGFYDHIVKAIDEAVSDSGNILDAGCGEGFYALDLDRNRDNKIFAFDYSKEAVKIAARGLNDVYWMVADITNIPLQNASVDYIFNIFSPANYGEFNRVLKEEGTLIKVVPADHHLIQLRNVLKEEIRNDTYSNQQVTDYFTEKFKLTGRQSVAKTLPISIQQLEALMGMSPLAFGIDKDKADIKSIKEITIAAELLIGKK